MQVGISIVSFQRPVPLKETLESLEQLSPQPHRVCIFENASPARQAFLSLSQLFPAMHWIFSEVNLGFAEGHHSAMQWLIEQDCDALLLLNPDLNLPSETLGCFEKVSNLLQNEQILGPLLLSRNASEKTGSPLIDSCGLRLDKFFRAMDVNQGMPLDSFGLDGLGKSIEVDGICGAALWVPVALLPLKKERLFFDSNYFAYFEDTELALFCKQQGLKMSLVPNLHFIHDRGGFGRLNQLTESDWQQNPEAVRGVLLNRYRCWFQYFNWKDLPRFPGFLPYEIIRWLYIWFRKPYLRTLWKEMWRLRRF